MFGGAPVEAVDCPSVDHMLLDRVVDHCSRLDEACHGLGRESLRPMLLPPEQDLLQQPVKEPA